MNTSDLNTGMKSPDFVAENYVPLTCRLLKSYNAYINYSHQSYNEAVY